MKQRLIELDYARVILMLSIISLHVSSTYIFSESKYSISGVNFAFFLNQSVRFGVPGFIILSGAALNLGKSMETVRSFYFNRLMKVVLPYFLWYTLYFIYNNHYYPISSWDYLQYFQGIFTGNSAPHLYFIVIISQLYILYPIFKKLIKRFKYSTLIISFTVALFFQLITYLSCFKIYVLPAGNHLYLLFFYWAFYFVLGMSFTRDKLMKLIEWSRTKLPSLAAMSLVFAILFTAESKIANSYDLSIKPQLFLYTPLVLATAIGLGAFLKKHKSLDNIIAFLSAESLDIYFAHVIILILLRRFAVFQFGMSGMLLLLIAVITLCILFAVAINFIKQKIFRVL